jgi:flagellar biogenesis protein FliO
MTGGSMPRIGDMSDRTYGRTRPAILLLLLGAALIAAQAAAQATEENGPSGPSALANGSISLEPSAETPTDARVEKVDGSTSSVPVIEPSVHQGRAISAVPAESASESTMDAAAINAASVSEAKPLGKVPAQASAARARVSDSELDHVGPAAGSQTNEIVRVGGALAAVIGLLFLVKTVFRRAGSLMVVGNRPSGVLEILARYPVARGQHLVVLKMARRVLLLHQSGAVMTTLSEVTDQNEVASLLARMEAGSRMKESARFRAALNRFDAEHEAVAPVAETPVKRAGRSAGAAGLETEVIDLTRSQVRGFAGLIGRRAMR